MSSCHMHYFFCYLDCVYLSRLSPLFKLHHHKPDHLWKLYREHLQLLAAELLNQLCVGSKQVGFGSWKIINGTKTFKIEL